MSMSMMIRTAMTPATVGTLCSVSARAFATSIPAASVAFDKFKGVLRDYRLANFDHTFPKRYVKDFIRGVDKNHDSFLDRDELLSFLRCIGASERLTPEELDQVMNEILTDTITPQNFPRVPVRMMQGMMAMPQNCPPRVPVEKMQTIMLDGIHRGEM